MKEYDNVLLGNGMSIKIIQELKKRLNVIEFYDYLKSFIELPYHKKEKKDFNKIYEFIVYMDEINDVENFIAETYEQSRKIGFERMISSKMFIYNDNDEKTQKYDRLIKNVSSYYFCLYNFWYNRYVRVFAKDEYYQVVNECVARKIKEVVSRSIYTLNFDSFLCANLNLKYVHGQFVKEFSHGKDLVSMYYENEKKYFRKFLFGTNGWEKGYSLNEMYKSNVLNYDYEFMFGNQNFGKLLIYGVAFGSSNIIPKELSNNYENLYLVNCVEGHILVRLEALYQNKKIDTITISYFTEDDKDNYVKLFALLKCQEIVDFIKCDELF